MKGSPKIILVHYGIQLSFEVASELEKSGILLYFITSIYEKRFNLTYFIIKLWNRITKKKMKRRIDSIDDSKVIVINQLLGWFILLVGYVDKEKYLYNKVINFSKKIYAISTYKIIKKHYPDIVIVYESIYLFDLIDKNLDKSILKIVHLTGAPLTIMKSIAEADRIKMPQYYYSWEREFRNLTTDAEEDLKGLMLADFLLSPSTFVTSELLKLGIDSKKIYYTPQFIETKLFSNSHLVDISKSDRINFLYIGRVSQPKGVTYMFEAFKGISKDKFQLTIVGQYWDDSIYKENNKVFKFLGVLDKTALKREILDCHVLINPTLSEGMSTVNLEALSFGRPVITTVNSGFEGIIKNYYNGFLLEAHSSSSIKKAITLLIARSDLINDMSINSRTSVEKMTSDKRRLSSNLLNIWSGVTNENKF